jgi:hypothetical protein
VQHVDLRALDRLLAAGRPANDNSIDRVSVTEPVVHAPLVLRAEARRRRDLLHLHTVVPLQFETGADRASIARLT